MARDDANTPTDPLRIGSAGTPESRLGARVGEYRLTSILGIGGMAVVYEAEHVRLGRKAAIKMLKGDLGREKKQVQRFFAEAKIVASLQHPHVVDVIDFLEEERPCIIMELLRGQVLKEHIKAGPMPVARAVDILAQILGVLSAVHGQGIVHRDLNPKNVFLVDDGVRRDFVKILDFGVAKLIDSIPFGYSATNTGSLIGTPQYLSPEQIEGRPITPATDVYAVGLIAFELLAGARPFHADSMTALLSMHLLRPAPDVRERRPDTPTGLVAFIERCLQKRPEARFASADQARAALDAALLEKTTVRRVSTPMAAEAPPPAPPPEEELEPAPRPRWVMPAMIAFAISVGLGMVLAVFVIWEDPPPPAPPPPPTTTTIVVEPPDAAPEVKPLEPEPEPKKKKKRDKPDKPVKPDVDTSILDQ